MIEVWRLWIRPLTLIRWIPVTEQMQHAKRLKRSSMQPQASAATADDHLLLRELRETSAATVDTPPAWDLCGDSTNVSISPCFTNSGSLITTHRGVL